MKEIPDFDIERSQSVDYIMGSGLAKKAFEEPPFKNYANILKEPSSSMTASFSSSAPSVGKV